MGSFLFFGGRSGQIVRLVAVVAVIAGEASSPPRPGLHGPHLVVLITLVLAGAADLARIRLALGGPVHRSVLTACLVEAGAGGVLVGYSPNSAIALIAFASVDAGVDLTLTRAVAVTTTAAVATLVGVLASGNDLAVALVALAPVGALLVGLSRRQYLLRIEQTELRLADAERAREEHARAARLDERAGLAREIHDVLAHSLGALVLQLDALEAVLARPDTDDGQVERLVAEARRSARSGLEEARRAVGTLRQDVPPIVDSLGRLVDEAPGSARPTLVVSGTPRPLDANTTLALYRTCQEGLTNARKHAPGSEVEVRLAFDTDVATLSVTDRGAVPGTAVDGLADTGGGVGLEGLRERAELLGGSLRAGPEGPGWAVCLRVPQR